MKVGELISKFESTVVSMSAVVMNAYEQKKALNRVNPLSLPPSYDYQTEAQSMVDRSVKKVEEIRLMALVDLADTTKHLNAKDYDLNYQKASFYFAVEKEKTKGMSVLESFDYLKSLVGHRNYEELASARLVIESKVMHKEKPRISEYEQIKKWTFTPEEKEDDISKFALKDIARLVDIMASSSVEEIKNLKMRTPNEGEIEQRTMVGMGVIENFKKNIEKYEKMTYTVK